MNFIFLFHFLPATATVPSESKEYLTLKVLMKIMLFGTSKAHVHNTLTPFHRTSIIISRVLKFFEVLLKAKPVNF